ncbi:MAG: hypothetical protein MN733_04950 [Nitrososphaera sp.]|nr:hypothetical protein [Nitrososphaera sp.]
MNNEYNPALSSERVGKKKKDPALFKKERERINILFSVWSTDTECRNPVITKVILRGKIVQHHFVLDAETQHKE